MRIWRDSRSEIRTRKNVECKHKVGPIRERHMEPWPERLRQIPGTWISALKSATRAVTKVLHRTLTAPNSQASGGVYYTGTLPALPAMPNSCSGWSSSVCCAFAVRVHLASGLSNTATVSLLSPFAWQGASAAGGWDRCQSSWRFGHRRHGKLGGPDHARFHHCFVSREMVASVLIVFSARGRSTYSNYSGHGSRKMIISCGFLIVIKLVSLLIDLIIPGYTVFFCGDIRSVSIRQACVCIMNS